MSDTIVIDGEVELLNVIDGDPDVFIGGGGSQPTGTKSILLTEAGTKTEDVADYAYAEINAVTSATASGAVASFSDGAEDVPMDSCVVDIEPVQSGSGDPSPSNVRPISGWSEVKVTRARKNLIDSSFCTNRTQNGIKTVRNNDGSITITGTASSSLRFWNSNDTLNLTLKPGTYTLSPNLRLTKTGGYDINTFTLTEETTYRNIVFLLTNGQTYNETFYPQLEIGSTATSYAPYVTPTEYPISLGQTVYGGTLDVVTGVLTVDRAIVDLGSFEWASEENIIAGQFRTSPACVKPLGIVFDSVPVCSVLKGTQPKNYNAFADGEIGFSNSAAFPMMRARSTVFNGMTETQLKTYLTGQKLVYKLATPTTVQLTPTEVTTLLGSNSVWADSGSISVEYKADIFLYADSLETIIDTLTGGA